jgi:hypothetical protein
MESKISHKDNKMKVKKEDDLFRFTERPGSRGRGGGCDVLTQGNQEMLYN